MDKINIIFFLGSLLNKIYKIKDKNIKHEAKGSALPAIYVTAWVCTGCTTNKRDVMLLIKIFRESKKTKIYKNIAVNV